VCEVGVGRSGHQNLPVQTILESLPEILDSFINVGLDKFFKEFWGAAEAAEFASTSTFAPVPRGLVTVADPPCRIGANTSIGRDLGNYLEVLQERLAVAAYLAGKRSARNLKERAVLGE
jgi:hypothetical protein